MELHEYIVHIPKRLFKTSIIPLGDFHIGSKACSLDKLKELVRWIKKQSNTYVIGLGDYADCINISDPRFSYDQIADNIKDAKNGLARSTQIQADQVIDLLTPIKNKIIGLGEGNHEKELTKRYHYDIMYRICGALNVKYLGWTSLTRFKMMGLNNHTYSVIILSEHSRAAGRKKGGKVNALEDRTNDFEADIVFRGHSHDKVCTTKVQLYLKNNLTLGVRKRVYAICPSFYNTYAEGMITYGEELGYSPTSTGVVKVDVEVKTGDIIDYHIWQ